MSFQKKLHNLRIQKGLSQKALATALGVSQASVNYWEKGQRIPSMDMIAKISRYFGISADELIEIDTEYVEKKIEYMQKQSVVEQLVGEVFDPKAEHILYAYSLLNDTGKSKALERVSELTEIKRYTEPEKE